MPTWTLTPANGTPANYEIADYKADAKGVVLAFAVNGDGGTESYHLAPEQSASKLSGILSSGMDIASQMGGASMGMKLAEDALSKFGEAGGIVGMLGNMAGASLGAFLAHTAEQSATQLFANREIEKGNYYNSGGQMTFAGLIKVRADGSLAS